MESLCEVHTLGLEQGQGRFIFNAFGDRFEAECAGEADNCFDDVEVLGAGDQVADELDVDLEVGDGAVS